MSLHKIAVIGGDGIGPEVTREACTVLKVLQNVLPELKLDLLNLNGFRIFCKKRQDDA